MKNARIIAVLVLLALSLSGCANVDAQLHRAISELPEIQKRRLILYYFQGLTYEQIAEMESCTKRAVKFSVDIAVEKLKKFFKNF